MTINPPTLVSLGISCQTAHQLADYVESQPKSTQFQKSPFDWLICPPSATAEWLDQDLCDFDHDDLNVHRDRAHWARAGLWFWHGFFVKQETQNGEPTRQLDIQTTIDRELEKLAYQRRLFRQLNPHETIFVISNTQNNLSKDVFVPGEEELYHFTARLMEKLQRSLDDYFDSKTQICWITRPDRVDAECADQQNIYLKQAETSDWKGDNAQWRTILDTIIRRHR